jgi:putative oxidoreductase
MAHQAIDVLPGNRVAVPATVVTGAAEAVHVVLRVGAGFLFLQHGLQKTFGLLGGMGAEGVRAPLQSMMGAAGLMEIIGGAMIIIGLFTRPVAFILAVEMIAAYAIAHVPNGPWPIQNGGELALLYAMVFLWLGAYGAGPLSVDRGMTRTIVVREVAEPVVTERVHVTDPIHTRPPLRT